MLIMSTTIAVIGVTCVWLFSAQIAYLALGGEFREGALPLFTWLSMAYGLQGIAMSFDMAAYGSNKTVNIMWAYLISALLNIGLNIWLIPIYATKGAAIATMFSMAAYLLVMAGLHAKPGDPRSARNTVEI
jgi:O-antigen/teichoic acid export membrane protein